MRLRSKLLLSLLLMTGYSDRIEEIQRSGVTLLPKPFAPEQLAKAVHELLSDAAKSAAASALDAIAAVNPRAD